MGERTKITKLIAVILFFFFSALASPRILFSASSYVLPYPSAMPGNKTYPLHLLEEKILQYWYFGGFSSIRYNRELSDKYLVEAKILFEYQQFPLALSALHTSDIYFQKASEVYLTQSPEKNGMRDIQLLLHSQAQKHQEILQSLIDTTQREFVWQEERADPVRLKIHEELKNSRKMRGILL
ncbi:MAG: hypothetical protein Q8Q49_05935 [bacterium]|nr:hypothetical protein [bacterium]